MLIRELTPQTTHQQLFDYITAFLIKQGKTSFFCDGSNCAYRGEAGRMCAIGCIIPDSIYSPYLEGLPVNRLIAGRLRTRAFSLDAKEKAFFTALKPFKKLLVDLQMLHDNRPPVYWPKKFAEIAAKHGLVFNPDLHREL